MTIPRNRCFELDGVYRREGEGRLQFVPIAGPAPAELQGLVQRIAERK